MMKFVKMLIYKRNVLFISMSIIEVSEYLIFQATPTYSRITINGTNGYCYHVNGGLPSTCLQTEVENTGRCAAYCNSQLSCIGFTYSRRKHCHLYVSDSTCPTGFDYTARQNTAQIKDDLVAVASSSWVCYGKKSGKSIKICSLFW